MREILESIAEAEAEAARIVAGARSKADSLIAEKDVDLSKCMKEFADSERKRIAESLELAQAEKAAKLEQLRAESEKELAAVLKKASENIDRIADASVTCILQSVLD